MNSVVGMAYGVTTEVFEHLNHREKMATCGIKLPSILKMAIKNKV